MSTPLRPAEVTHPGEYIKDELEERGWKQSDFVAITGADPATLSGVINGKRSINTALAVALGRAFDTSSEMWIRAQFRYDQWHAAVDDDNAVERKARLYQFPIREMAKRGWVDDSSPLRVLEHQMEGYFESFPDLAARRSRSEEPLTQSQMAWLHRTKQLACCMVDTPSYSAKKLRGAIEDLKGLLHTPEETSSASRILRDAGVRFVVVQGLPGLKLDGVCYWLDEPHSSPVVALSLRYDRIDNFWFVLRHELEHVLRGHAKNRRLANAIPDSFETTLSNEETDVQEKVANDAASEFCVPKNHLDNFIARWQGYFQKKRVEMFALSMEVHPGLVVGQLHGRGVLQHKNLRKMLVSVRDYVVGTTMTDGWGIVPQVSDWER